MPNPNNCSTCEHRKDTDGGWCYMFRNAPSEVCFLHTARKLIIYPYQAKMLAHIQQIDFAEAELLVAAFRANYPALITAFEKLAPQTLKLSEVLQQCTLELKALQTKLPREDKRLRTSSKTGATWPKPKGSY